MVKEEKPGDESKKRLSKKKTHDEDETETFVMEKDVDHNEIKAKNHRTARKKRCI